MVLGSGVRVQVSGSRDAGGDGLHMLGHTFGGLGFRVRELHRDYIGIVEEKMDDTIYGLGLRVWGTRLGPQHVTGYMSGHINGYYECYPIVAEWGLQSALQPLLPCS